MKLSQRAIESASLIDLVPMPYWRLSSYYFFYFASLGALVPYWGLYLKDLDFTPLAIGELMAIFMATKIIAPNLWAWAADHCGKRLPIMRFASLASALVFAGVFAVRGFWDMVLVMTLFSFFWNASLPQMEAVTFNHLGSRIRSYASIRLWGSIGFIIAVLILGAGIEQMGTGIVPGFVLGLFAGIWFATLSIPEPRQQPPEPQPMSLRGQLRKPEVAALLGACFLMQASHGPFYTFYSIYLIEAGYASATVGALWAWGVVLEVLVFLVMHRILERFGARDLLLASLALAILRWLLTAGFVHSLAIQILAQALHAATFGVFHAAAIHLTHHYFPGPTQGRGQALYSSVSFGAGGALGSLFSGMLWGGTGSSLTFVLSALVAGLGWVVVWRWVDPEKRY